ncbi:hypothetical protein [Nocardia asteroides]|uniref:hypothetical protein n=1 Tax=Nocardia asteroides TaxID=1824 RepID=UPI001E5AC91F|nr:hypothetical protein [Nocardia asteroides]UGT63266.1 hypothetical protein LTT61_08120 [Nocardia asteroides]
MRRALLLPVLLISALLGGAGTAHAEPATPSATPPSATIPLLTLTAIPNGWQTRVDLRPELQVYADGRAVRVPDAIATDRGPDAAPHEVEGTVPADVLKAAVSETAELAELDLGLPSVSDQGSRIIDVMPERDAEAVHAIVYAPGFTDGLNDDQKKARDRFDRLYRKVLDAFQEKR